jgi:protein phosphatase 2C family protein 2/3
MRIPLPIIQPAKVAFKPFGNVISYAANTHNGISRSYNEDRISIVLDLKKPS